MAVRDIQWQSRKETFYDCTNLVINASDSPNLSQMTNMSWALYDTALSTPNHNALLSGWSKPSVQDDVSLNGGNNTYSSAAQAANRVEQHIHKNRIRVS